MQSFLSASPASAGLAWRHFHILALSSVLCLASFLFSTQAASAAIVVSGSVNPAYNNTDPWAPTILDVGYTAPGSITVNAGSVINSGPGAIGLTNSGVSSVIVDGAGSAWNLLNSSQLEVGDTSSGTLQITNGGSVTDPIARIGSFASGGGSATVGAGTGTSTWSNTTLSVGYFGDGSLQIVGGGTVSDVNGFVGDSGGAGIATVGGGTGAALWTNTSTLIVGNNLSSGTLNIVGGGTVTDTNGTISTYVTGQNNFIVNVGGGIGAAKWDNSGQLAINGGTLNINTGGSVSAATLAGNPFLGTIQFDGGTLQMKATGSSPNTVKLLAGGGTIDVPTASSTFSLTTGISGIGGLSKTGGATLSLTGVNTYSGGTTVGGGTVVATGLGSIGNGALTINNSATMKFQGNLGTVVLPSLNINSNSASPTAVFDIDQNSVVIPYTSASPFATVRAQVLYGANNGTGIISSTADGSFTGVGYAEASELGIDGGGNYLNHQPTTTNTAIPNAAVILKYTYIGDFNLDGKVTQSDFSLWNANNGINDGSADWFQGDANYDGNVSLSDFSLWNANSGATGLSDGGPVPVPEPSTLVLAVLGLAGLAAVVRRRGK